MSEVFLCAKDQLDNRARRDLRKAGIVVVEVDDPATCQFIRSAEVVSGSDMLWAVLDALNVRGSYGSTGEVQRERVAANLLEIVMAARHGPVSTNDGKAGPDRSTKGVEERVPE